jgi:hypothetical protein
MAKKKVVSDGNMPQTEQKKCPVPGTDTSPANAYPRCTEHDLSPCPSRTRIGAWGDEQTFYVTKRGNRVTEDRNY